MVGGCEITQVRLGLDEALDPVGMCRDPVKCLHAYIVAGVVICWRRQVLVVDTKSYM